MLEAGQGTEHIVHQGETGGPAAEILVNGLGQALMVTHQQVDHPLQALTTALGRDGALADEGALLPR